MKSLKQFNDIINEGERLFYTDIINMVSLNWHEKKIIDTSYYPNYQEKKEKNYPDRSKMPFFKPKKPTLDCRIPLLLEYIDDGKHKGNFRILLTEDIVLKDTSPSETEAILDNYDNNPNDIKEMYEILKENPMTVKLKDLVPYSFFTETEKEQLNSLFNHKHIYKLLIKILKNECQISINNSKNVYKEITNLYNLSSKAKQKTKTKA